MSFFGWIHNRLVYDRRMNLLADRIALLLPQGARVLDVGCGDGRIDSLIMRRRPDVAIFGIDVLVRENTYVPVAAFDGERIPYKDKSFDAVIFIDVLHHTGSPEKLLREAKRVSRGVIVLKDHIRERAFDNLTLRLMDWVGNAHYGVVLPYNYWSKRQWQNAFSTLGLKVEDWDGRIGLYPWPASWVFDRSLHFIARVAGG